MLSHAQLNPANYLTDPDYSYRVTKKKLGDATATEEELEIIRTTSIPRDYIEENVAKA